MGIENGVILLFGLFFFLIIGQSLFRDFSLKGLTDGVMCWLMVVTFFAIAGGLTYLAQKYGKGKVIVYSAFIVLAIAAFLSFGLNMIPGQAPFPGILSQENPPHNPNIYTPPNYHVKTSCPGATAICMDGTCSYSHSRSGTCSWHGGVRIWLTPPWN